MRNIGSKASKPKIEEQSEDDKREYERLTARVDAEGVSKGGQSIGGEYNAVASAEKNSNDDKNIGLGSVTLKLIAAAVYQSLLKNYGVKSRNKSSNKPMSPRAMLYLIISLASLGFIVYNMFSNKIELHSPSFPDSKTDSIKFEEGRAFEDVLYLGKKDLLVQIVSHITKMVHLMRTMPEKELQKIIETTQKNFLFHGPAGTGKTLFMKKLVHVVDINMKFLKMREKIGEEDFNKMNYNKKLIAAKNMRSLTRITFVRPSILNSKYVGETEKNIHMLFEAAANSPEHYWATFIFIDEVDVFFSKRSEKSQDYALKSQTEFLNLIGGACDKIKSPVFIFGATNLYDFLDDAFLRRFSGICSFDLPDKNERWEILERYLHGCKDEVTRKYDTLVDITDGLAQSRIIDVLKKLAFNHDGKWQDITWEELQRKLIEANPKKGGAKGNKIVVDEALRSFYLLDPPSPKKRSEGR